MPISNCLVDDFESARSERTARAILRIAGNVRPDASQRCLGDGHNRRAWFARLDCSQEAALAIGDGALVAEVVRMGGDRQPPSFLILLREVKTQYSRKVADAARGYGLTRAEQRLLRVLFDGISLPEAARCLGVARTTARTHLQRLFEKTGTRRQADLLRTIALGHAALLPG
jgi:DNA-binding CsgD family transcriptional regulator